jgi:hypothetical protein
LFKGRWAISPFSEMPTLRPRTISTFGRSLSRGSKMLSHGMLAGTLRDAT